MSGQNFITPEEFQQRRLRLMSQCAAGDVLLLPAASLRIRNRDAEYHFRQDSSFWYLTGFHEPDALLVMLPDGDGGGESILFCLPKDPEQEIWTGYRVGAEGVVARFGFDQGYVLDDVDEQLPQLLKGKNRVFLPADSDVLSEKLNSWKQVLHRQHRSQQYVPQLVQNLSPLIDEMRLVKSPAEQQQMKAAAELSAQGHIAAMQRCQAGEWEYHLEAEIQKTFADQGARFAAYNSIVGGGANACVLHYTENQSPLQNGDLVLIDAGAELSHYAGDITRTFPVSGTFTEEQRALYQIVLDAQFVAIEAVAPGNPWDLGHDRAVEVLTQGLVDLGLLEGDVATLMEEKAYRPFYMHRTGHWLGLDVHDVGEYVQGEQARPLEPGMVLTVEPGLYIAPDNESVDPKWRGIGIRIEDDVLVTDTGCEVLSASVPKTIEDIEALMAAAEE